MRSHGRVIYFFNRFYTFPSLISSQMTWLNGSCTVTLLHLALISPVLVCCLCFRALKSCDHLKKPRVNSQSCFFFFFFNVQWPFFHLCFWFEFDFSWCYCVFYWSEEDIFRWVLFHKCFILKSIFNSSLFFSRFMKQVRKDFNNASDNLPCRTSAMQMQRKNERKKKDV